ncbi:pyridoxamine 5'-phosphate oxidase family protein [Gluconacetobacter azotocaptans]|uniref:pyridoxamine 5'-phosphate oxidase family protein n=1 Tax=Gluconacetobacter azotocaptans TaxID=142834 RepID=UPI0019571B8F|nr:pyridoxamine 5'-phosphate oxidase family protein [Gluconacetobacter azotocaptans]MBM9400834.1 pyridoxamine 5'-phosphate oxidase family protein [Gluconacetobacter azotocaptans]
MTDSAPTAFHDGERRAQALAAVAPPSSTFIRPFMPEQHRRFFAALPYVVLGTLSDGGWPVATFATGHPGFLSSPDETTLLLTWDPPPGDPVANAISPGSSIAILGIEFATRRRNRANGIVLSSGAGATCIRVLQSFGNCPQYIRAREAKPLHRTPGPAERLSALDAAARRLITAATTLFVASCAPSIVHGGMDVSHRGGPAGFVRIDGDVLTVPDYPGNRYFNTFGNLIENPRAGLLFVDFGSGDLLHVAGDASVSWNGAERSFSLRIRDIVRQRAALPLGWIERPEVNASASARQG